MWSKGYAMKEVQMEKRLNRFQCVCLRKKENVYGQSQKEVKKNKVFKERSKIIWKKNAIQQVWILYVFVLILNFFVLIVEKQTVVAKRHRIVNWTAKLNQPKYLGTVLTLKKKFKKCFFKWKSKILWSFVPTGVERLWIPSGLRLIRLILAGDIYKERL